MSDLVEFLLTRIAEDEGVAQAATSGPWVRYGKGRFYDYTVGLAPAFVPWPQTGGNRSPGRDYSAEVVGGVQEADGAHIARWDPARVLAECEAKRRIVGYHSVPDPHDHGEGCPGCDTMRALALPYADHPDYRAEWSKVTANR